MGNAMQMKSVRDVKQEEKLEWLRKQIAEMEGPPPPPKPLSERIKPRIRRNGKWVE